MAHGSTDERGATRGSTGVATLLPLVRMGFNRFAPWANSRSGSTGTPCSLTECATSPKSGSSSYLLQFFGFGANGSAIHPEQYMSCLCLNSHSKYFRNI
jgi:hypothetical protein